ncbi:FAD binding domain family protein [Aspergillus niger]|uniref:FAD binding domain family protein n=1 Tax=Aspergillus niger TaxID=5061 RepID=A0A505HYI3_ASPNG|nr:FAD binding domain family protein [Aspergillus niger]
MSLDRLGFEADEPTVNKILALSSVPDVPVKILVSHPELKSGYDRRTSK